MKAVGFFVVFAAILAFLALPNSQAGAGKPIKWKATFVAVDNGNLMGVTGQDFVGGVDGVNITNGSATCEIDQNVSSFLEMQFFAPSLQFCNMGGFSDSGNGDLASCGFPNNTGGWPDCVANFLNSNVHPTADYEHIILRFSTCGCGNSTAKLMDMEVDAILPVRMSLLFFSHIWGCPPNSPFTQKTLYNLLMKAHGYLKDGAALPDIYIKRISPTEWIASVDTIFDNPDPAYQNLPDSTSANFGQSDNILGQYATCDFTKALKGNKTTWTTTYHYPWAKAPLKFQIKFWKY